MGGINQTLGLFDTVGERSVDRAIAEYRAGRPVAIVQDGEALVALNVEALEPRVAVALDAGHSWPVVLVIGMVTGCMGGLMRDVVCNEVPLVLKQGELYATCALAGSLGAVLGGLASLGQGLSLLICAALVFTLRAGSIALGWRLPVYKSQPPSPGAPKR